MKFATLLKLLRTERGMTQKQLASQLGVTDSAVRLWETQHREPSFATLIKIAQIFEVTVGQLLGTEEL